MASGYKEKVILVSDFGRSGQGWLSFMLCYLLNAKYIEPSDFSRGSLYSSANQYVIDLTSGNLPGRKKSQYSMVIKTHGNPASPEDFKLTDKVIFLTRDPRDVAVSMYFMYRHLYQKAQKKSLKRKIANLIYWGRRPINYYLTARGWKKHYERWQHVLSYHVTYEDLSRHTNETLRNILNYLGVRVNEALINSAIKKFSFEKMNGGRARGTENRQDIDFRKGIIGDYKNYFSRFELWMFNAICSKAAKKAGYDLTK